MNVMNKSVLYYLPVVFLVCGYLYFSHWTNQNWNEAVKFGQKVEYDEFGKQVTKLNVHEAQEDDFYIVIDSQKVSTFFKVLGITNDGQLAVQYGKGNDILPNTLDYENYAPKKSYNFNSGFNYEGPPINWVDEIINIEENFNEKITMFTLEQLDELLRINIVIGFIKKPKGEFKNPLLNGDLMWDLRVRFSMGEPVILIPIILLLLLVFWISEKLKKLYFTEKRDVFYYILAIFGIAIFSYFFGNDLRGPTYNGGSDWYGIIYIFTSYVLTFLLTNHFKQYFNNYNFAKRQFLYFFTIIFIGILCEILIKSAVNYVFYTNNPSNEFKEGLSTTIFWIFTGSFKNWLMIATAHFLNNLIGYISSLRRKSKQLQTATSDAQISTDALQQSEAHVNTHFLYNSLHAIAALAPVAPDKTETLALSLAKYYRYTTNRNDETWITIKEEVEALPSYLEVEKIRLGEKLTYAFVVSDDDSDVKIPKFLLQPLVENAVKYGYDVNKDTTNVELSFHKLDHTILKISVCDRGKPFSDQMEIGIGIRQVKDLLKRFYPDGHTISFVNEPEKCVEMVLDIKKLMT